MNLFKNLPIRKKLLIILLLISILPLVIITYGFHRIGKAKLTEQTVHVLKVQAENVAVSINRFIDYKFKHLRKVADIPQLINALLLKTEKEKQPHIIRQTASSLRAKLRIDPDFLSFCLLDTEGNVVLGTCDKVDTNFRDRPSFCKANKGEKYVSPPSLDKGKPAIYFSMPIRHANNIVGVLVAQCDA
ncbi:MAG: hypothetical protein Q6358_07730, partial [Candidatus Brocadiales bacterium]|nr:hypothetical protein [Candidatus Brocadiales bacterium]